MPVCLDFSFQHIFLEMPQITKMRKMERKWLKHEKKIKRIKLSEEYRVEKQGEKG